MSTSREGKRSPLIRSLRVVHLHGSCVSIDGDVLVTLNAFGGDTRAQDRRDMVFAGDDGAVTERAADVGDDTGGQGEERCPGGGGDLCHQDIAVPHRVELAGT